MLIDTSKTKFPGKESMSLLREWKVGFYFVPYKGYTPERVYKTVKAETSMKAAEIVLDMFDVDWVHTVEEV